MAITPFIKTWPYKFEDACARLASVTVFEDGHHCCAYPIQLWRLLLPLVPP